MVFFAGQRFNGGNNRNRIKKMIAANNLQFATQIDKALIIDELESVISEMSAEEARSIIYMSVRGANYGTLIDEVSTMLNKNVFHKFRSQLNAGEQLYKTGTREFVAILCSVSDTQALLSAKLFRNAYHHLGKPGDKRKISIGAVFFKKYGHSANQLLNVAKRLARQAEEEESSRICLESLQTNNSATPLTRKKPNGDICNIMHLTKLSTAIQRGR